MKHRVLRFFADATPLALVSSAVAAVEIPRVKAPHICDLLGWPRHSHTNDDRVLSLHHEQTTLRLQVDGPVAMLELEHAWLGRLRAALAPGVLAYWQSETAEALAPLLILDMQRLGATLAAFPTGSEDE